LLPRFSSIKVSKKLPKTIAKGKKKNPMSPQRAREDVNYVSSDV
jgi:hypothetical protein